MGWVEIISESGQKHWRFGIAPIRDPVAPKPLVGLWFGVRLLHRRCLRTSSMSKPGCPNGF